MRLLARKATVQVLKDIFSLSNSLLRWHELGNANRDDDIILRMLVSVPFQTVEKRIFRAPGFLTLRLAYHFLIYKMPLYSSYEIDHQRAPFGSLPPSNSLDVGPWSQLRVSMLLLCHLSIYIDIKLRPIWKFGFDRRATCSLTLWYGLLIDY